MSAEPDPESFKSPYDRLLVTSRPQHSITELLEDPFWRLPVATYILWEIADWWTTIDGERLKIAEMEPSHAANVVRFLERKGDGYWRNVAMVHHLAAPWFMSLSELEYQEKYGWERDELAEFEAIMDDPIAWARRLPRMKLLVERSAAKDDFDLLLESL